MKKKWVILFILLIILIIINIMCEIKNHDLSSDPKDDDQVKISTKIEKETDDNKFQTISDCFAKLVEYYQSDDSNAINSIYSGSDSIKNITDFSIQEIYKIESKNSGIFYSKIYVITSNKLETQYYKTRLDYNKSTFEIINIQQNEYVDATKNRGDKSLSFSIDKNESNSFEYNFDYINIALRYINDYSLKSKYSRKEAINIYSAGTKIDSESIYNVIKDGKKVNDKDISYYVVTDNNEYEVKVYSLMNYKIDIN